MELVYFDKLDGWKMASVGKNAGKEGLKASVLQAEAYEKIQSTDRTGSCASGRGRVDAPNFMGGRDVS